MDFELTTNHQTWPLSSLLQAFLTSMHVRMLTMCTKTRVEDTEFTNVMNILSALSFESQTVIVSFMDGDSVSWDALRPDSSDVLLIFCPIFESVFLEGFPDWAMRSNVIWLAPNVTEENLPKNLRLDSMFFTYSLIADSTYEINEVFRIKRGSAIKQLFGTFYVDANRLEIPETVIWRRRGDLHGIELANTVLEWKPFLILGPGGDFNRISGIMPDLIDTLKGPLNFTVRHYPSLDEQWGIIDYVNGSEIVMTGHLRELQLGRADICTAGLYITYVRQVTSDMVSVVADYATLIMPKKLASGGAEINAMAYLLIFAGATWLTMAIAYVGVAVAFMWSRHEVGSNTTRPTDPVHDGFEVSYKTLLQISVNVMSLTVSNRIILFSASIMGLVLYSYFCSDLTAQMTHKATTLTMQNFEDVLASGFKMRIVGGTSIHDWFRDAPRSSPQGKLHQKMLEDESLFFEDFNVAATLLENSNDAVSYDSSLVYQSMDWALPVKSFQTRSINHIGWAFQLNSEFLGLFSFHLTHMRQSGVIDQVMDVWMRGRRPKDEMDHRIFMEEATTLGFDNLLFPAVILSTGIVASILLALLEMAKKKPPDPSDNAKQISAAKLKMQMMKETKF